MPRPITGKPPGRPPHIPTEKSRQIVKMLAVSGYTQEQIGPRIGCEDEKTLRRHYRTELDDAKSVADANVTQSILMMSCGGPKRDWTKANANVAIFYAKTRMGWKEPKQEVALSGAVGTYDMTNLSDEEVERVTEILERAAGRRTIGMAEREGET